MARYQPTDRELELAWEAGAEEALRGGNRNACERDPQFLGVKLMSAFQRGFDVMNGNT